MRNAGGVCVQISGVNMASQEDDNKLESKSNVNKEQERNFINVYKKFEYILKNKNEPFNKKIESLIEIWRSLGQYSQQKFTIGYIVQIMDWAKLHTLNIVLTGKWKMYKADFEMKLLSEVQTTQNELTKISNVFSMKFQKLADVIKNPWDDPVLANLLHDSNAPIGQKEIEFFCIETAYLVSVRLKKLCESQCEDLALNLVTAFMNCYNLSQTQNFNLNATEVHILFCFDIHVALLYRYNRMSDIVSLFKKLSLEGGLYLIRRFAKKRVKISKVWRHYPDITFLASQVFVTAAVTKPIEESGNVLKDLLDAWITFSTDHSMIEKLETSIRRIIQAATAAQHIYICCEIIHHKFGLKLKTFTVELYIRALTTDMNNLESQKTDNEKEKVEQTTKRLANGFYNLADILKDNVQVSRECALTAFSLEPTLERLRKIEDLARQSGFNVLDTGQIWECKLHPPISSSDDVCWICNSCGKWMCRPNLDLRLTTNFALNEALNFETLGISSQLCDDLAVVLNGPRYHLLSWLLRWEDLHRLCEMYLNDMEHTKNLVTDLKFVDIDYSMFVTVKREPVDELAGIERGYERFLYSDEKLVNMLENANPEPPEVPQAKSNPDTLKTLRMFRHNIKRNKPQVPQTSAESNNLVSSTYNYSKDSNWFSEQSAPLNDVNMQEQFSPASSERNGAFTPGYSRLSENPLNNVTSQGMREMPGAVDFSMKNLNHFKSQIDAEISLGLAHHNINTNKRKPNDVVEDGVYDQNCIKNSSNDALHDVNPQEFMRINSDMKRSKSSDIHSAPCGAKFDQTSRQSHTMVQPAHNLTQSILRSDISAFPLQQFRTDSVPSYSQTAVRNDNLTNSEKLSLLGQALMTNNREMLQHQLLSRNQQTLDQRQSTIPSSSIHNTNKNIPTKLAQSPIKNKCEAEKISLHNLLKSSQGIKNDVISSRIRNVLQNQILAKNEKLLPHRQNLENQTTPSQSSKDELALSSHLLKNSNGYSCAKKLPENFPQNNTSFLMDRDVKMKETSKNCIPTKDNGISPNERHAGSYRVQSEPNHPTPGINQKEATSMEFNAHVVQSEVNNSHNFLLNNEETSSNENVKRSGNCQNNPSLRKKLKLSDLSNEQEKISIQKNGTCYPSNRDSSTDDTIPHKACEIYDKVESTIQNENSSKNANCCLPLNRPNKEDSPKNIVKDDYKLSNFYNSKTSVIHHGNNNAKLGADNKSEKGVKESSPDKNALLKTLSDRHIPIIVDKPIESKNESIKKVLLNTNRRRSSNCHQRKAIRRVSHKNEVPRKVFPQFQDVALSSSDNDDINNDLFKYEDTPKPNTYKELKIILHRLSSEVIKSFIPSYTDKSVYICHCGLEIKRARKGRPRKSCLCGRLIDSRSNSPSNRIFDSLKKSKNRDGDKRKNGINRNVRQNSSDQQKKTVSNKNLKAYKKVFPSTNEKESDYSDNEREPKKDFSERNKTVSLGKDQKNMMMNPRVVLERLPLDSNYVKSVLSNVPGLNDYEMIRPGNVDHIVNVVQISGGRTTTTVPVQNSQTSTQITPHIQRIGQPRSDKPEHNTNSESSVTTTAPPTTTTTTKPTTSQPTTLINILSQQIIRPGQSNCVRNRSSPLINILSQQIIRPATTQINKAASNSAQTTEPQASVPKVVSTIEQAIVNDASKTVTSTAKTVSNTPAAGQGTILQFICKSTLPKFQQAFGKSVYQNNTETSEATSVSAETTVSNSDANKKTPTKNAPVNIQPIQGGVIYTRQMPVGQTISLIPPGRGQVFRIATSNSDQISLVKDTVIHSKMSALLAAALQGKQKTSETQSDGETASEETSGTRVTVTRPNLVQNARIVKPVLQIPSNVIRTSPQSNLSSTTLEQLREFDMVYKQIKERSSTSTPSDSNTTTESNETSQRISVTYLNNQGQKFTQLSPVVVVSSYCNLQPAASPALSVTSQGSSSPCVTPAPTPSVPKVSSTKSSKGKTVKSTTTQASKASPIPKPQQKPQEDEHTTQRIFDILAEYAEQLRNSPDLNNKPAPRRRSNPPTNPSQNSKRKKSSSSKKSGQCSSMVSEADIEDHRTVGSEDSSCGVVQISVQEDEQPHIQTVTTESNDSTSGSRQQLILTDAGSNQTRNLIIADSSVGEALKMPNTAVLVPGNYIMPVSMVKGGQQIAVVSGGSKILATVPTRSGPNMLLFQSFLNQNRNKSGVPTVKYSTIQPISGISSQSLAGVSGQPPVILPPNSHNLTAVALGQPITLKKVDETDRVNTELLLTISQPRDNANNTSVESTTHPDSTNNSISSTVGNIELEESMIHSDNSSEKVFTTYQKSVGATPIATPVIAQTSSVKESTTEEQAAAQNSITLNITSENNKNDPSKGLERVQSVLVTTCTANGPMLSHTPPRYRKPSESAVTNTDSSTKEEYLHNGEKQNNNEQKQFPGNAAYFQNKSKKATNPPRLDRELHQLCLQRKQAALERELRLQKSLSEECEDLGVDEPSTSDLFPEADILFDSNHSPSFDQTSQDLIKRASQDIKEENKSAMTLFSDDDNSNSLRTDFLFESVEYQTTGAELEYDQNQQLTNGQSSASNASGSSCEDHTLLQNCASMSDVTLNSPVSPDPYNDNTPPSLNKYKFKYSNRRKGERHKQSSEQWTGEVSSSEDTTGSTELGKSSSHSPESCTNKRSHSVSCDELSDGSYKVVRVAISKSDLLKDEESCEELHCEDDLDCSPSGRGARRSVKKMCSCCNGSQDGGASRKRPASRPHTPASHKKAFLTKKR